MGDALNVMIGVVQKNAHEDIRITLTEFKGTQYADIRVFTKFAGPADARTPTKSGVAIPFARLHEVVEALQAAESRAREMGLIGGDA
jgi:hypothetical protein